MSVAKVKPAPGDIDIAQAAVVKPIEAGAGLIHPLSGEINTMSSLGSNPGYLGMDIETETGMITELS